MTRCTFAALLMGVLGLVPGCATDASVDGDQEIVGEPTSADEDPYAPPIFEAVSISESNGLITYTGPRLLNTANGVRYRVYMGSGYTLGAQKFCQDQGFTLYSHAVGYFSGYTRVAIAQSLAADWWYYAYTLYQPVIATTVTCRRPTAAKLAFTSNRNGAYQIFTANTDGTGVTLLTTGAQPAWSPNGQKLAFVNNGVVHTINRDGTGLTAYVAGADPQWHPSGNSLVFTTDDGIVSQPLPSGSISLVRSHDYCMVGEEGMCATPRYAALGTQIAYVVANLSQPLRVQVVTLSSGSAYDLLPGNPEWSDSPTWTFSGSRIVYTTVGPAGVDVVSRNSDGTSPVTLVSGFDISVPAIAPNGSDVGYQYSASATAPARIWIKRASSAAQQLIPDVVASNPSYEDIELAWSSGS